MVANFRLNRRTNLITTASALLMVQLVLEETFADDTLVSPETRWLAMEFSVTPSLSQILYDSRRSYDPDRPTFVITHGMGGTKTGDRFHRLADGICKAMPECNVLIIDWSKQSWQTGWFGIPNPLAVARNIDSVAKEASELLMALPVAPTQTTYIGESFGNCVNARVAESIGGQGRILAFNPPNAVGGYRTPDLRACSEMACSFQTYSMYDTQDLIADFGIFLETCPFSTDKDQHIAGVSWLAERVKSGDLAWLLTLHDIPAAKSNKFEAVATLSGELQFRQVPRKRPEVDQFNNPPTQQILSASTR